jgi:mobilization protein NikA
MRQTVSARDSTEDDFAALLERLTLRAASGRLNPEPDDSFTRTSPVLPGERRKRTLAPVTEVKPHAEAVELSYEKALRLHSRRNAAPQSNEVAVAKASKIQDWAETPTQMLPSRPARRTVAPRSKPEADRQAKRVRKGTTERAAAHDAVFVPRKGKVARAGKIVNSRVEIARPDSELERKQAIVSMRLSDTELQRLRDRAAESGMSVSGYMRSCVLDAEHLRLQVKEALAEMRASMAQQTPLPGALTMQADRTSVGGGWLQLLARSATFLLGPLLLFRHRS